MPEMRESDQYPGFLEKDESSSLRAELDRDFGDDNQEKLRFVTAQLEAKKSQLENLGEIDSTNHTDQDMDRIVNYPYEIAELEAMKNELEAMLYKKNTDGVIDHESLTN